MAELLTEAQNPKDAAAVATHIEKLPAALIEPVRLLRELLLGADPQVGERIKWNNPAFYFTGPMLPADPKAHAREIAVFNLFKERLMLVFTHGAGLDDPAGLLGGAFKDSRRTIVFQGMDDIRSKGAALQDIVRDWIRKRV